MLFPGALGDAVCLEPTVARLARSGPVVVYARGGAAEVTRLFPDRPEVRSLDAPEIARLFAPRAPQAEEPDLAWLAPFARIVSFTGAGVAVVRERLSATGRAVVAPFPRPPAGAHASDYFLQCATGNARARAPEPRLASPPGKTAGGAARRPSHEAAGPRRLAIHPGAGSPGKRAPAELLLALAERWRAQTRGKVAVLTGPAEGGAAASWRGHVDEVLHPASVAELAAEIAASAAFVGNDSGPSHVAAALGVPGLVLFCRAPDRFAPRSARLAVLRIDRRGPADAVRLAWQRLAGALP